MKIFFAFIFLLSSASSFGNPSGAIVVSGNAAFSSSANELLVTTTSDRTVIDWSDFSIGVGETATFTQPALTSAVLNRVVSESPSNILGLLKSNGTVFLINQNGILVGANGCINVKGLVASTLDVANGEFLAGGDILFSGNSTAAIQNLGLIQAHGNGVFLLGRHIINQKDILAISSNVSLGAGNSILLRTSQSNIVINPDIEGTPADTGIDNSGDLLANQVEFRADGNLYTLAIRHTGTVNAVAATELGGEIYLVAESGTTTLQSQGSLLTRGAGTSGGTIHVLGETVNILDESSISTQGERSGGTILIGGSFGGLDPNILNATNTTIAAGTEINSRARLSGNAGDVSVFALDTVDFQGSITATGGIFEGNGGMVELAAQNTLIYEGTVDTKAYNGTDGAIVLDAPNIITP